MQTLFGYLPSAIENTGKIADMVDIEIPMGVMLLPKFTLPDEDQKVFEEYIQTLKDRTDISLLQSDEWYLRYLSFVGLNWRFDYKLDKETIFELIHKLSGLSLGKTLTESSPDELKTFSLTSYTSQKQEILAGLDEEKNTYIERLEYELTVIHEMGFDGYFLIVADYIGWARKNDIPVGPGRGSAAGSLMAYLSGITDLDPLKYGLLFERFLNPARISMPDIDTDFSDEGRDRVVDYCRQKYGEDHVAQVCTFGTFAARAAVKDV